MIQALKGKETPLENYTSQRVVGTVQIIGCGYRFRLRS